MKTIKKVSVTPIEGKTGHIYDTTNVDNKNENTYSANVIDKFNTYSTTEQVVGTWIDGKPIYRMTVDLGSMSQQATTLSYTIGTNVNLLLECKAIATKTNSSILIPAETSDFYLKVYAYSKNSVINIDLNRGDPLNFSDRNLVVTVEYTKTTS
jgi:hypothetical protein